jgi:transcriptional regulator with XRE-family HTH domain
MSGTGGAHKLKYPQDGWSGAAFRRRREARDLSREYVAARTGISSRQLENYESDRVFPPHKWRDAAAVAIGTTRRSLGMPQGGAKWTR